MVDRLNLPDWACCKHWAVIVKFDNRTLAFEIIQIKDGKIDRIAPRWTEYQNNGRFDKMIFLGSIKSSPEEVQRLASKNSHNGTVYDPISNNCQEWVKELLAVMDTDLLKALNKNDIKTIAQRFTDNVASSFSSFQKK
jgi:hypothetical protein